MFRGLRSSTLQKTLVVASASLYRYPIRTRADDQSPSLDTQVRKAAEQIFSFQRSDDTEMDFGTIGANLRALVQGGSDEKNLEAIQTLVGQMRKDKKDNGNLNSEAFSMEDMLAKLKTYSTMIQEVADKYVSDINFDKLTPTSLLYYLEHEDEIKNPSWKNRIHRFCTAVKVEEMERLNQDLVWSHLSYADTEEEIQKGCAEHPVPSELAVCELESRPGEPAYFIAIPKQQDSMPWAPLDVIMAVRGTKSLEDAITDIICDAAPYRDGKAHQYIIKAGTHVFEQSKPILEDMAAKLGRSKIRIRMVGHSLGAGAASIAAIEFNELSNFEVKVTGFGCPALLTKEMAVKYKSFITTIVNDGDPVPRMSAATMTNLLLRLVEFDWRPYLKKDIKHAFEQLNRVYPSFFDEKTLRSIRNQIEPMIDEHMAKLIEHDVTNRVPVEIFPPGNVIHLYDDGYQISCCYVPNDYFGEIDLSRRLVDDHLIPPGYERAFLRVMRETKRDHHFRFDAPKTE